MSLAVTFRIPGSRITGYSKDDYYTVVVSADLGTDFDPTKFSDLKLHKLETSHTDYQDNTLDRLTMKKQVNRYLDSIENLNNLPAQVRRISQKKKTEPQGGVKTPSS